LKDNKLVLWLFFCDGRISFLLDESRNALCIFWWWDSLRLLLEFCCKII